MGTTMTIHKQPKERFGVQLGRHDYTRVMGSYTCLTLEVGDSLVSFFWRDGGEEDLRKLRHAIDEYLLQQVTGVGE